GRRDAPLSCGLELRLEPAVGRRGVPPQQPGELPQPPGGAPAKYPGLHDYPGGVSASGLGLAAEPTAFGLDPDIRAGGPDEPAGLYAGDFAAGSQRTGRSAHPRDPAELLAGAMGTVCRKPDRLPGWQRNAGAQIGGDRHRCLAIAGVVAPAGALCVSCGRAGAVTGPSVCRAVRVPGWPGGRRAQGDPPAGGQPHAKPPTSNAKAAPEMQAPAVAEAAPVAPVAPQGTAAPSLGGSLTGPPTQAPVMGSGATIQPKDKQQLASDRVQNPHEPEATYAVKGRGENKKEHVGYKVQVAETVCEVELAPGEPTRNFITGIVTHPAYEHDEVGALKMEAEQAAMGLDKPPVQYVDSAYISAQKLVQAQAEGRELIGPALPG